MAYFRVRKYDRASDGKTVFYSSYSPLEYGFLGLLKLPFVLFWNLFVKLPALFFWYVICVPFYYLFKWVVKMLFKPMSMIIDAGVADTIRKAREEKEAKEEKAKEAATKKPEVYKKSDSFSSFNIMTEDTKRREQLYAPTEYEQMYVPIEPVEKKENKIINDVKNILIEKYGEHPANATMYVSSDSQEIISLSERLSAEGIALIVYKNHNPNIDTDL